MNKIEKSELLIALYAKQEEANEKIQNAKNQVDRICAQARKSSINAIIQMVTDDF